MSQEPSLVIPATERSGRSKAISPGLHSGSSKKAKECINDCTELIPPEEVATLSRLVAARGTRTRPENTGRMNFGKRDDVAIAELSRRRPRDHPVPAGRTADPGACSPVEMSPVELQAELQGEEATKDKAVEKRVSVKDCCVAAISVGDKSYERRNVGGEKKSDAAEPDNDSCGDKKLGVDNSKLSPDLYTTSKLKSSSSSSTSASAAQRRLIELIGRVHRRVDRECTVPRKPDAQSHSKPYPIPDAVQLSYVPAASKSRANPPASFSLSKSQCRSLVTTVPEELQVILRNEAWLRAKKAKLRFEREEKELGATRGCTFRPQLSARQMHGGSVYSEYRALQSPRMRREELQTMKCSNSYTRIGEVRARVRGESKTNSLTHTLLVQ